MAKKWLWWQHGVIYQIYPRSFYDSNGDGVGDITGIIQKLDYLQDLGIDGIWLSPINQSPMHDFGYDISDYRKIDPIFGTNQDFYNLIKQAHKRKIRIIMDLVINHSSHEHPWFKESSTSRDNPKSDWYVWQDCVRGRPPNNWLAAFGGEAWEWSYERQQYYLHTHLIEQPDLNWRNEDLKKAIFKDIEFWFEKGVDGFRLDVINFLLKDKSLRSNPFTLGPSPRPYDLQKHIYDRNQVENHAIIQELRQLSDSYKEKMLVGEVYAPTPDPKLSASYLGNGRNQLHMAFDFSIMYTRKWHAKTFYNILSRWYSSLPPDGWPCFVLSNHDQPRSLSRFGGGADSLKRARVAAALMLTIRGTPFIYYGEEIGMRNGKIKRKQIQDPVGLRYWPFHKGRDPERTPMLWSGSEKNAGFSSETPWLPINPEWQAVNVVDQKQDPDSLLNFYRCLIAIRKKSPALMYGDWVAQTTARSNYLIYCRRHKEQIVYVLLNFSNKTKTVPLVDATWELLYSTHKTEFKDTCNEWQLEGYEITLLIQIQKRIPRRTYLNSKAL